MLETLLVIAWTSPNFILICVILSIADVKTVESDGSPLVLEGKYMCYMAGVMCTLARLTAAKVIIS